MCFHMERNVYGIIISWPLGAMTDKYKKQPHCCDSGLILANKIHLVDKFCYFVVVFFCLIDFLHTRHCL